MPGFYVHMSKSVLKDLSKIPLPWHDRLRVAIDFLEGEPFYGEKMSGEHRHKYKIVVWPYRILYRVDKDAKLVEILEVGHRGGMSYK